MSQPYPKEFRDDVVRVALNRDEKTTIAQIAKDFGGHEGTIAKWLRQKQTSMPESSPAKTTPSPLGSDFGKQIRPEGRVTGAKRIRNSICRSSLA